MDSQKVIRSDGFVKRPRSRRALWRPPAARVAWIFGQRPKRQKHVSAGSVTFAKANNLVSRGVRIVRRS